MILHTVAFKLKHQQNSVDEAKFITRAKQLADITSVNNFQVLKQISSKNSFDFALSMEFNNNDDYQFYNHHPQHIDFVENYWLKEVVDFIELDYQVD
ncbi:MAG: Dabb family protein [Thalassotalea sp.]